MRRRRPNYEREIRRIILVSGLFLAVTLVAVALLFILAPFRVNLRASYDRLEGTLEVSDAYGNELTLAGNIDRPIQVGEWVRVETGSRVRIELVEDSRAFAYLMGPAEWRVISAWRDATGLNHIRNQGDNYQVVVEQKSGTAVYDFSRADPSLENLNVVIQFPDGEVKPASLCFQVSVGEPTRVVEVPCNAEITPMPLPTLPALP